MQKDEHTQQGASRHGLATLFLMTEKGYVFLREASGKYKSLFSLVVVGTDKSIQKDFSQEIIDYCRLQNIRCVKKENFEKIESEYALAVSWRWLITHPAEKLIVFHDSLLPKYRGFSPLVNALLNGETEIGVTAIFGEDDFDKGDIIAQSKSTISYPIKIADAIDVINKNYIACAAIVFECLTQGKSLPAIRQDESAASYSVWRDEQDYKIDWSRPASEIRRLIDAVGFPYKGAFTHCEGKLVRILAAEEAPEVKVEGQHDGKVMFVSEGKPIVICGKGMLRITEAYMENDGETTTLLPLTKFRTRFANS
jgi:methionyl-tRNA formyltransferase